LIKIGNYDLIKEQAVTVTMPSDENEKKQFMTFLINKGMEDCTKIIKSLDDSKANFEDSPLGSFESLDIDEYFAPLFFIYETILPLMLQGKYDELYQHAVSGEDKEDFIKDSRTARRKLIKDLESKYGYLFDTK
jgi:hypothetical protein